MYGACGLYRFFIYGKNGPPDPPRPKAVYSDAGVGIGMGGDRLDFFEVFEVFKCVFHDGFWDPDEEPKKWFGLSLFSGEKEGFEVLIGELIVNIHNK